MVASYDEIQRILAEVLGEDDPDVKHLAEVERIAAAAKHPGLRRATRYFDPHDADSTDDPRKG